MSGRSDPRVFLCKDSQGGGAVPASFEKCCLTVMGCKENRMDVGYKYQNERLEIYPIEQGLKLAHPTGCPCRFLTASDIANIPEGERCHGVKVAVAVLLQSSDGHVLLTRRAEHMRTFPCVWVPPGGHVEPGETLHQAFLRELSEETGLTFSEGNLNIAPLGLWESVFPPILSMGLPVRHHIVVYFLAQAREDHRTLQGRLNLHHKEVDAATWLDEATATEAARSDDFGQSRKVPQRYFRAIVIENSHTVEKNLPLSNLMSSLPRTGEDGREQNKERLSTGTKFALRQWIKFLYSPLPDSLQRGDSFETVFHMITKAGHQPVKSPFWSD
ncbi:hypothetical protein ACROYT_G020047 [Oculina patagonica]